MPATEDAAATRRLSFTLVGAFIVGVVAYFNAMLLYLSKHGPLIPLAVVVAMSVVGGIAGALLGRLVRARTRPSVERRTRLLVFGAVGGLLVGLVFGFNWLHAACEPAFLDRGPCGYLSVRSLLEFFWAPLALWVVAGVAVGGVLNSIATRLGRKQDPDSSGMTSEKRFLIGASAATVIVIMLLALVTAGRPVDSNKACQVTQAWVEVVEPEREYECFGSAGS